MANVPINPPSLVAPRGYAHGVLSGTSLQVAGQTALDRDGRIVSGGIVEQFRQAMSNVLEVVRAAGGHPEDLVGLTIYLTDIPDYQARGPEIGAVWRELMGRTYPAIAAIGCTGLWQTDALIEITAVAVVEGVAASALAVGEWAPGSVG